jgi:hypothetical protein
VGSYKYDFGWLNINLLSLRDSLLVRVHYIPPNQSRLELGGSPPKDQSAYLIHLHQITIPNLQLSHTMCSLYISSRSSPHSSTCSLSIPLLLTLPLSLHPLTLSLRLFSLQPLAPLASLEDLEADNQIHDLLPPPHNSNTLTIQINSINLIRSISSSPSRTYSLRNTYATYSTR